MIGDDSGVDGRIIECALSMEVPSPNLKISSATDTDFSQNHCTPQYICNWHFQLQTDSNVSWWLVRCFGLIFRRWGETVFRYLNLKQLCHPYSFSTFSSSQIQVGGPWNQSLRRNRDRKRPITKDRTRNSLLNRFLLTSNWASKSGQRGKWITIEF